MSDDKVELSTKHLLLIGVVTLGAALILGAFHVHRAPPRVIVTHRNGHELAWCSAQCRGPVDYAEIVDEPRQSIAYGWVTNCADGAFFEGKNRCEGHTGVESQDEVGGVSPPYRAEVCHCQDGALFEMDVK